MSVIAIWGAANSGKTTLSIELSYALSGANKSVLIISAEPYAELPVRMRVRVNSKNSLSAAYQSPGTLRQAVCKADDLLFLLSPQSGADVFSAEENTRLIKELLKQARDLYDYVIVDCPSNATSALAAWALRMADMVLMSAGCRSRDVEWHHSYRRYIWEVASKTLYVCTEITRYFDYDTLLKEIGAVSALHLPHINNADMIQETRRSLCEASIGSGNKQSDIRAYQNALNRLVAQVEGRVRS